MKQAAVSSTDQGDGKWRSFWGIYFPKTESFQNSAAHGFFTLQNVTEMGAFEAMTPRKSTLISLSLNCGSPSADISHTRGAAKSHLRPIDLLR
jgi:hypothetical protein